MEASEEESLTEEELLAQMRCVFPFTIYGRFSSTGHPAL